MKIKILKSCAGLDFSYSQGQEVEASDEIAKDLIRAKHAEAVEAPKVEPKKKK